MFTSMVCVESKKQTATRYCTLYAPTHPHPHAQHAKPHIHSCLCTSEVTIQMPTYLSQPFLETAQQPAKNQFSTFILGGIS